MTLSDDQRRMLLSGKSADGLASAGPIVCACFGVGRATICDAIAAGARTAAEIGAKLKAGTNCGSCIPELKRLIATTECAGKQAKRGATVGRESRAPNAAQHEVMRCRAGAHLTAECRPSDPGSAHAYAAARPTRVLSGLDQQSTRHRRPLWCTRSFDR